MLLHSRPGCGSAAPLVSALQQLGPDPGSREAPKLRVLHPRNIALHFDAGPPRFDRDGVVWSLDYVRAHDRLPRALRDVLDRESADVLTAEMLASAAATLPDFDGLAPEPFLVFLDPPSLDQRIVNQFSVFSVMSGAAHDLRAWLEGNADLVRRIRTPADLKWEIRDKLDQANVTERVLFPGLDGISRWLKRYYGALTASKV